MTPRPVDATLVVARELGIDEIYAIGGAQAVAALAYGTATIPSVDRIVGPGNAFVTAAKLLVSSRVGIDLPAGPSEVVVIADETADAAACAADLLAQAEHGPDSEALLLSTDPALSAEVAALVARYDNITVETVASLSEALSRSEEFAPEHLELHVGDPDALLQGVHNAGSVFIGGSAVIGDYAAGATHVLPTGGLARSSGGLGLEMFMKPLQVVRVDAGRRGRGGRRDRPDRACRRSPLPRGCCRACPGAIVSTADGPAPTTGGTLGGGGSPVVPGGGPEAVPLPAAFAPYAWAATVEEVAARHGLEPAQVLKFDQNTPPLPGVAQVPLAESFATLNRYPSGLYRELREAAAAYVSTQADVDLDWQQIVVGAGADDLILLCAQTFLAPGRKASIVPPTYAMYRIATLLHGAEQVVEADGASLLWRCNPENPTGATTPAAELVELARRHPEAAVVVDEAYVEYGGESVVPWLAECPNLIVLRTMSKAFGYAGAAGRVCDRRARHGRPARGPSGTGPDRVTRRAHRGCRAARPALRRRVGDRRARARARGARSPQATTLLRRRATSSGCRATTIWARASRPQGIIVRRFPQGIRVTLRRPSENDIFLRALGAEPGPAPGREATVIRTSTETALADHARARRQRQVARRHRNRLPRSPADAVVVPCRLRPRLHRGRRRRCRRAPHRRRRARRIRRFAAAGTRQPGGSRAIRLRDRADGRSAGHGGGRPRAATTRRDLACVHAASASAVWRSRCCRMRSSGSRWRPAAPFTSSRAASTITTSPRRRSRRSARRCGRPSRRATAGSARPRGSREGRAGRLRRGQSALGHLGARPRRSRGVDHCRCRGGPRGAARRHRGSRPRGERRARARDERPRRGDPRARGCGAAGARHLRRHAAPLRS